MADPTLQGDDPFSYLDKPQRESQPKASPAGDDPFSYLDEPPHRTFWGALGEGGLNYFNPASPGSIWQGAKDTVQSMAFPMQSAVNLGRFGRGEYGVVTGNSTQDVDIANAINTKYGNRYGSLQGFYNDLATDPYGVSMDAATVAMIPIAGAKALAARAGMEGLGTAADVARYATNPLTLAAKAPGALAGKLGDVTAEEAGVLSGSGGAPYKEIYDVNANEEIARLKGQQPVAPGSPIRTPEYQARQEELTKPYPSAKKTVDMAYSAFNKMKQDAYSNYEGRMRLLPETGVPNFDNRMLNVFQDLENDFGPSQVSGWLPRNPAAYEALQAMRDLYNQWDVGVGARTVNGFKYTTRTTDALKQMFSNLVSKLSTNDQAGMVSNRLTGAVRGMIRDANPEYADIMDEYSTAKRQHRQMEGTLSLKGEDGATDDQIIRKLDSSQRDQINTGFGERKDLVDALEPYAPGLKARLATRATRSVTPRGVARLGPVASLLRTVPRLFGLSGEEGKGFLRTLASPAAELMLSSPKFGAGVATTLGRASPYFKAFNKVATNPYLLTAAGQIGANKSPFENDNQ